MANPKRHWAIPTNNPRKHQHPWIGHAGGYYVKACGRKYCSDTQSGSAVAFLSHVDADPGWHCTDCARVARLALAKEGAPKLVSNRPARSCSNCRSGAINPGHHGRAEDTDLDLCDVCYWRKRAPEPRPIAEAPHDGSMVLICLPDSKPQWTMGVFDARQRWADLCLAGAYVNPTHFLPLPPSPEVK